MLRPFNLFEVLSKKEVEEVYSTALQILETIGIRIMSQEALSLFEKAGAKVDFESQLAFIPAEIIEKAIESAPRKAVLYSRDGGNDVHLGRGSVYFASGYGAPYVVDFDNGHHRRATTQDLANIVRIHERMKHTSIVMPEVIPQDVPSEALDRYNALILLSNTKKHCIVDPLSGEGVKDIAEMAATVVGGVEELRKKPILTFMTCGVTPLIIEPYVVDVVMETSKRDLPLLYWSLAQSGTTAPGTLAGALALHIAEILAGLALNQLVRPGALFIMGSYATITDLRYASYVTGGPETALLCAASTQMARYLGIPIVGISGSTESIVPDVQAGYEKGSTTLFVALSGCEIIHGAVSGWLESILTSSYEQVVINNEICDMVKRYAQGITITQDRLGLEVIRSVGPGPGTNFITEAHTLNYFKEEHWMPPLTNRKSRTVWEQSGSKDIVAAAREKVAALLRESGPVVEEDVLKQLKRIAEKAHQK